MAKKGIIYNGELLTVGGKAIEIDVQDTFTPTAKGLLISVLTKINSGIDATTEIAQLQTALDYSPVDPETVIVSKVGTTLVMSNVPIVTSVTKTGSTLVLT